MPESLQKNWPEKCAAVFLVSGGCFAALTLPLVGHTPWFLFCPDVWNCIGTSEQKSIM